MMAHELNHWYVGKLFWVNNELYSVTKIGETATSDGQIPLDVEQVDW